MTMTALDAAHAAMEAAPEDDGARLRFYERLADDVLFLMLEAEAEGETLSPRVFDLDEGPVVLAFDLEERLADFTGGVVTAYAALPGRVIAAQLAGRGTGLGLNLGVAPSAFLIPAEALDWLAEVLEQAPAEVEDRPVAFHAPDGLPEVLVAGLRTKLLRAGGLAAAAWLCGVGYAGGRRGHLLAFAGAAPGAEPALARAAGEALTFCGIDAGEMDVAFLAPGDPMLEALAGVALKFDLPRPVPPEPAAPAAPGMDPARPPILK